MIKTSDRKSETNYDFYQDYEENILLLPTTKPKKRQFVPTRYEVLTSDNYKEIGTTVAGRWWLNPCANDSL